MSSSIPLWSYNCGGYALGTYNWLLPYEDEDEEDSRCDFVYDLNTKGDYTNTDLANILLEQDVAYLLDTYEDLIDDLESLDLANEDDIVIAYRVCVYNNNDWFDSTDVTTDFHFKVRIDGQWYEKQGNSQIKECELKPDEFWYIPGDDSIEYNSDIHYFRRKKKI